MKHITRTTALAGVALLALTACGGSDVEDLSEEDRQAVAEDVVTRDFLDCEDGETTAECEVRYEEETSAEMDEAMEEYDDEIKDMFGGESTGRMTEDVTAEIGEPVEVDLGPFVEGNDFAATVTLSAVEFSDTCVNYAPGGETSPSEAGQFASLTWDIDVDAEADNAFDFNVNEFRWDDYHYALSTPTSLDCELDLGHQDPIEPGESGQYTAIWDVPTTSAELQWREPTHTVTWIIDGDEGDADAAPEPEAAEPEAEDAAESAVVDDTEPYSAQFPSANEVDLYAPKSHPDELMVDINTIEDCETAGLIEGSLMNGELEGFDIDYQYLGLLQNWMQGNGCWDF